jgi:hypothetical protein
MNNSTIDKFGRLKTNRFLKSRGPPGEGFKLTVDKNYDIQGKRLCNLGQPSDLNDAVTRSYVDKKFKDFNRILENSIKEYFKKFDAQLRISMNEIREKTLEKVEKSISIQNTKIDQVTGKTKVFETTVLRHLQKNQSPTP